MGTLKSKGHLRQLEETPNGKSEVFLNNNIMIVIDYNPQKRLNTKQEEFKN